MTEPELTDAVVTALRDMRLVLSMLNRRIGHQLKLRDIEMDCLDLVSRHGAVSPGALARQTGIHLATMTGILDRLERGGWIVRERDPADRRAVVVRADAARGRQVSSQYAAGEEILRAICADTTPQDLNTIRNFLTRTEQACRRHVEKVLSLPAE